MTLVKQIMQKGKEIAGLHKQMAINVGNIECTCDGHGITLANGYGHAVTISYDNMKVLMKHFEKIGINPLSDE